MTAALPQPGQTFLLDRRASVQFIARPIGFRVIRVLPYVTHDGWIWLDGYELDAIGEAAERREVFVQLAGLVLLSTRIPAARLPAAPARPARRR